MDWKPTAVAAAILVFGIVPASAQMRGGAGGRGFVSRPAPVAARPVAVPRAVASPRPTGGFPNGGHPRRHTDQVLSSGFNSAVNGTGFFGGETLQDLFGFPAPGLGFDYAHLAAVNGNLNVRALIDPVTQQELALALRIRGAGTGFFPGFFTPFGGTPVVIESPSAVSVPMSESAPQQPQPIYVVTPPAPAPAQAPVAEQEPLPDPGEFVLVQRDGRLLFAVAFTSVNGRLVYVTKDGLRRTIPLSQLDVDSTERMNEERGTSVQLPTA